MKNEFIDWLKSLYTIEVQGNVILVYTKINKKWHLTIPENLRNSIDIEVHYPEVIHTNYGNYFPGYSEHRPTIEFFTIKIN